MGANSVLSPYLSALLYTYSAETKRISALFLLIQREWAPIQRFPPTIQRATFTPPP